MAEPILTFRDVAIRFRTNDGIVEAVKGSTIDVHQGEFVAIVGESGSGKSQSVLAAMGLLAQNGEVGGSIRYRGGSWSACRLPSSTSCAGASSP